MSTDITRNDVENFFIRKFHTNKISFEDVKKLGLNVEEYKVADTNDDNRFDIDEICDMNEFYAAFTAIIQKEKESLEVKDADKEKAELNKVKEKDDAGTH